MTTTINGIAGEQLESIITRIERLTDERAGIADDMAQIYAEAKGNGFEVKIIKAIIRLRKEDKEERDERETLLDLYMAALGME